MAREQRHGFGAWRRRWLCKGRAGVSVRIIIGDAREQLKLLGSESVHCIVTSPPYFGLRDYGVEGQIGLEETPEAFVEELVLLFREARRVLRDDGTLWLNLGDSYARSDKKGGSGFGGKNQIYLGDSYERACSDIPPGLKAKDLIGIPWRVAFALQADGWYLRQDIIWAKPNPMPESVTDRCTKAHEYVFLLSKSQRYYYDADAIRTPFSGETKAQSFETMEFKKRDKYKKPDGWDTGKGGHGSFHRDGREKGQLAPSDYVPPTAANKRSVWTVPTEGFAEAHFATVPPALIEPCILAGCPAGGTVLDPFGGAGTTGLVADRLNRSAILIELNPEYAAMAQRRIEKDAGLWSSVESSLLAEQPKQEAPKQETLL
jgi:site-specific DNA-methyltransferase (cytosine-N4-specific)